MEGDGTRCQNKHRLCWGSLASILSSFCSAGRVSGKETPKSSPAVHSQRQGCAGGGTRSRTHTGLWPPSLCSPCSSSPAEPQQLGRTKHRKNAFQHRRASLHGQNHLRLLWKREKKCSGNLLGFLRWICLAGTGWIREEYSRVSISLPGFYCMAAYMVIALEGFQFAN